MQGEGGYRSVRGILDLLGRLVAFAASDVFGVGDGGDDRRAANDVPDQDRHHVDKIVTEGFYSDSDEIEGLDRAGDDVGKFSDSNDVSDDDDDADPRRVCHGQEPDHEGDQPSGKDAANEQRPEVVIHRGQAEFLHRLVHFRADPIGVTEQPGDGKAADQIGHQHNRPEPRHIVESAAVMFAQERQDDGESVLGEELLPAEDDDEKADAVTELGDQ